MDYEQCVECKRSKCTHQGNLEGVIMQIGFWFAKGKQMFNMIVIIQCTASNTTVWSDVRS